MAEALFTGEQLLEATGGHFLGQTSAPRVSNVVIDSRKAVPGSLFVALSGKITDGHRFLAQASEAGSVGVVVREAEVASRRSELEGLSGTAVLVVADTLKALQGLARYHLSRFPGLLRVGVTGSAGKTTTKEIIGRILSEHGSTIISEGNLNSETGLPLALFQVRANHRYGVFELGIDHVGEMDDLVDLYRPQVALITNIGSAHAQALGTGRTIAKEKKKIFQYLGPEDRAFVWEEDPYGAILTEGVHAKVNLFGPKNTIGFGGSRDLGLDGTAIDWEGLQIRFPLFGPHNLQNALAAISLTSALGVRPTAIKAGLEAVRPLFGRSQVVRGPFTVLSDCYNSNPESLRAMLSFFDGVSWDGRKIAVLGSMLELGDGTAEAHREIGLMVCRLALDRVFLFGEEMVEADRVCREECAEPICRWTSDFGRLVEDVTGEVGSGDLVLIKGSRGIALERILAPLTGVAV